MSESTCVNGHIQKGNNNNLVVNVADAIEKAVADFLVSTINVADNILGTVPGITHGDNYKLVCLGFYILAFGGEWKISNSVVLSYGIRTTVNEKDNKLQFREVIPLASISCLMR